MKHFHWAWLALLAGQLWLALATGTASACAVCGCGAGGYYLGLMPLQSRNYLGVRYRSASYLTHDLTAPSEYASLFRTKETFLTAEVVGRVYLTPRLMAQAYVPLQFHRQEASDGIHRTAGLGDAMGFVNYRVFSNLADTSGPLLRHALWAGVGIKAATGRYVSSNAGERSVANAGFMLGTGSWDPMALVSYTVRRRRSGLALDVSARYATQNAEGYAFGNRATAALTAFTIRQRPGWGFMPSAGLYLESSAQDHRNGRAIDQTGGSLLAAQAGADLFLGAWTIGAQGQLPLAQKLAVGAQQAQGRLILQAGFFF